MSSNLKVNTILPSTGTAIGIGTATGNVDVLGHIVGHNTPNISGINSVTASHFYGNGANLTGLNSDLVNDTSPQLGGDLASNGHDLKFADATGYDGNQIYMGSDNDVRIHHDGSNFSIAEATGDVTISAADDIFLKPQTNHNGIKVIGNGAVELYNNNSKKFETTSSGATLTGHLKFAQSGNGIDFSVGAAGASQSNVLDEYEEGVWTPALTDASSGGGAYVNPPSNMNARYIKIGRLVYLHFGVHAIGGTNAVANFNTSNPIYITGIPFPCLAQHSKHFVSMGYMPTVIEKNVFASMSQYNTWMNFQYHGQNTGTGAGDTVKWNMIHISSGAGYGNIAFDLMYETYP